VRQWWPAERAAKTGEREETMIYLKDAGVWAFGVAVKIGARVAAEAMKEAYSK
jgi:hypothetical protein